jgi:hypothetical protein
LRILLVHQNFPGPFVNIAQALSAQGYDLVATTDARNSRPDLVRTIRYAFEEKRAGTPDPLAASYASRVARGEAAAAAMAEMGQQGFVPDLVIEHPGWGETLLVKHVSPATKLIVHAEYYAEGEDVGFNPEFRRTTSRPGNASARRTPRCWPPL